MRNTRTVFAGKSPVVPKAGKHTVLVFVVTNRTAEMAADVADSLDLALILV
jgi:hypothetical protein